MSRRMKALAWACALVGLPGTSAGVAQDGATSSDPAAASAAGTPGWFDPDDIELMRWRTEDGTYPGTYTEYLEQHPLSPAQFSNRRIITPRPTTPLPGGGRSPGISVLVSAGLHPSIQTGLDQYVTDLTQEGYTVVVEAVSGGTPEEIKAWVAEQYNAGCEGVLFVGAIPVAWFLHEDQLFPCDLFYMDVDGDWQAGSEGFYVDHADGDGDQAPEVYVARLYTPTLSWDTPANMVNGYFDKTHRFRIGELTRPWRGLEYINHDWWTMNVWLELAYGEYEARNDYGHLTIAADYLDQLELGQHFVTICAHSSSYTHFFGTRPTYAASYAHVYVHSPTTRAARLLLGSDDGIKVWLNGDNVFIRDVYGGDLWYEDAYLVDLTLNQGWNRLLCKISQWGSHYRLSARLTDEKGTPFSDLGYQLDDPNVHGDQPSPEPGSHIGTWLLNGLYENHDDATRLSQDYLDGEADVRPSAGDPAPYGTWMAATRDACPFDLAAHYMSVYPSGGAVTSQDIQDNDPRVFFYNLFACGAGRFTNPDYIAGSYIFNTSYGLLTIASAKSGGMKQNLPFMEPLSQGLSFGQTYREWWHYQAPYDDHDRGWYYGLVLNGDPTLRLIHTSQDCNANGVPDVYDVLDATSADCNQNGRPDECEPDCNGNGSPDECDIADGVSEDVNGNGVPDECDPDCNGNGLPDDYDIANGTSPDCNGNGIPDDCDIADGSSADDNGNGLPDECELPVRYVNASAPAGGGGLTWQAAFNDLQEALDSAAASEGYVTEIWVAAGTYTPAEPGGDRSATFQLLNDVAVYGGFAGDETGVEQRDPWANLTILSGDLNGDDGPDFADNDENSHHVVTGSGCDQTAILDGFIITAGNANATSYSNGWGAGMYSQAGSPTLINCTFTGNRATYLGGGMFNDNSSPTVVDCTFSGNQAGNHGGGIHNYRSDPTLINCVLSDNSSEDYGGGIYSSRSSPTLINCTLTGNTASHGGAVHCENSSQVTITNCILWADSAAYGPEIALTSGYDPSTLTISYSDVQGGQAAAHVVSGCVLDWGAGNLDGDPLFDDVAGRLAAGSPCIDAADNTALPPDEFDLDADGNTTEPVPLDRDGNPRLVDDPDTADTGYGSPPIVDIGAYEFPVCVGDLDRDNDVDLADLAELLGHYGTTDGASYEEGDLDGDGDVDLSDLATMLGVYGTTCG